jgi:DNA mismatch repair protein MutL
MACKGAIKANEKLSKKDMKSLILDLMKCKNPYTCPHGRPTMIKMEIKELEKMFKRRI